MKIRIMLFILIMIVLLTGCGKKEEGAVIKDAPRQGNLVNRERYTGFSTMSIATSEPDPDGLNLRSVALAADGSFIMVSFTIPQDKHRLLAQDYVYIVDESNNGVYKDILSDAMIGELIAHPKKERDISYVMIVNYYKGIKSGSMVTVVLGNYKRIHFTVS